MSNLWKIYEISHLIFRSKKIQISLFSMSFPDLLNYLCWILSKKNEFYWKPYWNI